MTMYPINDDANIFQKVLFYFWRIICILCLTLLCVQLLMDVLKRNEFDLTEATDNIINIGTKIVKYI